MDAHRVYLTITGLDGPMGGRMSRADMGIAARRALTFPTAGAWFGGLPEYGPADATVIVDGRSFTGAVYHVRANGWPCIRTTASHIASGPVSR